MQSPRVAIVGYALEPYSGVSAGYAEELGYRVVRCAREQAGVSREQVSSVHNSTMDLFDGVTISNGILGPAAGGYGRDSTRVQNGGVFAVISACAAILSGASEVAVVSSADTVTTDLLSVSNFSSSVYFEQPLGLNFLTSYALFSSAWMDRCQFSEDVIAAAAENSFRSGAANEYAHVKDGLSRYDVLKSDLIAWPLRAHTVAMQHSYGAAAVILAAESAAEKFEVEPVFVSGFGMSTFADDLDDWLAMSAVRKSAAAAYAMAGVTSPAAAVAVEINAPFAPFEVAAYSALGLCSQGSEAELLRSAATGGNGMRINPSGGTLCTNAPNSGGLFRVVQAAMALQDAPSRGRKRAIVHDSDLSLGVAGSSHAVLVLEKG
ncbi:MAG: thiolase family protein [Planctomycetaceae bacterium]